MWLCWHCFTLNLLMHSPSSSATVWPENNTVFDVGLSHTDMSKEQQTLAQIWSHSQNSFAAQWAMLTLDCSYIGAALSKDQIAIADNILKHENMKISNSIQLFSAYSSMSGSGAASIFIPLRFHRQCCLSGFMSQCFISASLLETHCLIHLRKMIRSMR